MILSIISGPEYSFRPGDETDAVDAETAQAWIDGGYAVAMQPAAGREAAMAGPASQATLPLTGRPMSAKEKAKLVKKFEAAKIVRDRARNEMEAAAAAFEAAAEDVKADLEAALVAAQERSKAATDAYDELASKVAG
jgi:hypothetical protein